jgi:hypothetical protein
MDTTTLARNAVKKYWVATPSFPPLMEKSV